MNSYKSEPPLIPGEEAFWRSMLEGTEEERKKRVMEHLAQHPEPVDEAAFWQVSTVSPPLLRLY